MQTWQHILTLCITGALIFNSPTSEAEWFGGTTCAGRKLDNAYLNSRALSLAKAATNNDLMSLKKLINDIDVNYMEPGAVPVLAWALCSSKIESFEVLLKAGADPNAAGQGSGSSSFGMIGPSPRDTIIYSGESATVIAAEHEDPKFLELSLMYGGSPDAQKGERPPNRPLTKAAYWGRFDNIKLLVDAGADINVRDPGRGATSAPEYAIGVSGRYDIAFWLLEHGYSNDLQALASIAETAKSAPESEQQRWKEKLIHLLRDKGISFPASPGTIYNIELRQIPKDDIEDIILDRKNALDYPRRIEND